MTTVRIEHPVKDYASWKAAFDADPVGRRGVGVRRYAIQHPVDDPLLVSIALDFDDLEAAEAFLARMRVVWQSERARAALAAGPQVRLWHTVEQADLAPLAAVRPA